MRCLKPSDNQGPHACDNNPDHCSAYLQTGCPDYTEAQCRSLLATQTCDSCRWTFCGTACFTNHMFKTQTGKTADHQQLSVCTSRRKCDNCQPCRKLLVGCKQQQEHLCGYVMCPSFHHYIEALSQRCFIQVAKTPEEERAERQTKTWLSSAWCCCRLGHRALQQRRCALHFSSSFTSCGRCQPCRKLLVGCKQQQEHLCGYVMRPSFHHYIEAPCNGASFKWLRLPRKNGRTSRQTKTWLSSAWCCCRKNLRYTYSSTWRPCRTRDITFRILSWSKLRTMSIQSASWKTRACATISQAPQAGVSLLQLGIQASGSLQTLFPHHHRLCLQPGSPSQPHGS